MKIVTTGSQAFNVPNNEEGQTFLRLMRKFINRPRWRFRGLGRGARRYWSVSQAQSEWIAVYLGGGSGGGDAGGSQFKQASLLSYQDEYQLWQLKHGGAKLLPKKCRRPSLSPEEKAYLQFILESHEEGLTAPGEKESGLFYGIFQKLVDI